MAYNRNKRLYEMLCQYGGMFPSDISGYIKVDLDQCNDCKVYPNERLFCCKLDTKRIAIDSVKKFTKFSLPNDDDYDELFGLGKDYDAQFLLDIGEHAPLTDPNEIKEFIDNCDAINEYYNSLKTHIYTTFINNVFASVMPLYLKYKSNLIIYFYVGLGAGRIDLLFPDFIIDAIKNDTKHHHLFIDIEAVLWGWYPDEKKNTGCAFNEHTTNMYYTKHHNKHYYQAMDLLRDKHDNFDIISIYGVGYYLDNLDSTLAMLNNLLEPTCVLFHWGVSQSGAYDHNEVGIVAPLFDKHKNLKIYTEFKIYDDALSFVTDVKLSHNTMPFNVPKYKYLYLIGEDDKTMQYKNRVTLHPCGKTT